MIYQKDSSKAEEFIHHEEILDTLEYAQNNKDNRVLIEQLIEKAALCKGLTHREAAILLECNQPENVSFISLKKSNRSFTATVSSCSHRFIYLIIA